MSWSAVVAVGGYWWADGLITLKPPVDLLVAHRWFSEDYASDSTLLINHGATQVDLVT